MFETSYQFTEAIFYYRNNYLPFDNKTLMGEL